MSAGFSNGGAAREGGVRRRFRRPPISEINVTPFVDVMLVLLVIFMIAAPLLSVGVPVEMPRTEAGAVSAQSQPITLSVDGEGNVWLQETQIKPGEVGAKLKAVAEARQGVRTRIFLRGDRRAPYEAIARVLASASAAGFGEITLSSLPLEGNRSPLRRRRKFRPSESRRRLRRRAAKARAPGSRETRSPKRSESRSPDCRRAQAQASTPAAQGASR